ncbi:hypothetical protein SAMN05216548_102329 [Faunimonas pinastri]|uniref:VWA domain-containing protein n=1 Tax=Faunimonas pinastri TaxID=1855383 RepID=A0A1H9D2H6_9HYPH|nr:VWA domain-containing protein [Faunimonas pinastri]SEQ07644.1 hypothetical protein SAMN05216548_102329 [Faunimonas pinastri]
MSGAADIVGRLIDFAGLLRKAAMTVGPASVLDALRALEIAGLDSREDVFSTLQAAMVTRREDRAVFAAAFDLFWRENPVSGGSPRTHRENGAEAISRPAEQRVREALAALSGGAEDESPFERLEARRTAATGEHLKHRDFAGMSAAELREARRAIERLALPHDEIRLRRLRPSPRGRIDPRQTFRAALRTGGDFVAPSFRAPDRTAPTIVALCDISGSMGAYSRVLLFFLHAIAARRPVQSFVFGTRLTNITRSLRTRDPDEALAACAAEVPDWSGGTRIAPALHAFNRDWSRRVLGQKATLLLITDGLERQVDGNERGPDLAREMDRLHRSCRRLIWLNPLLRFDAFQARASGIRAMLPHVDEFRPAHSLASVEQLVAALSSGKDAARADPRNYLRASRG